MTQEEIEPVVRAKHLEIREYLGGREGRELLRKHGLRRSRGIVRRTIEGLGKADTLELHERWRGLFRPVGSIYVGSGAIHLNAIAYKEERTPEAKKRAYLKLQKFADELAEKHGLRRPPWSESDV